MHESLLELLGSLDGAARFEDVADVTLRAALSVVESAVERSDFADETAALRGMVHVRPGGEYRRYFVREGRARRRRPPVALDGVASSTAWRWVCEQRARVAIDVTTGTATIHARHLGVSDNPARFEGDATRARLRGRDTTHLLAIPIRRPGQPIEGMISIEASCKAAIGRTFVWSECAPSLDALAAAAGPYVLSLPAQDLPVDDRMGLPVVGAAMREVIRLLRTFADEDETLLLLGPTGVGKSRLAEACHDRSKRRNAPFEAVELGSVPEALQFGVLTGWRRGAFTDAVRDTKGAVERARGGTLFLDEIDKLSLEAQNKLLRLLETRRYRALGHDGAEAVADVRFIIATNRSLDEEVTAGRFREDLYYRINVLPVRIPTLGERTDEIEAWAHWMLGPESHLLPGAGRLLAAQAWPGNLRQLHNIVRRAAALARQDPGAPACAVDERLVEQALGLDPPARPESGSLVAALRKAAELFVEHAREGRLEFDDARAFGAFVVARTVRATGSVEDAYRLLGKGQVVDHRNHQKALRQDLEHVRRLCARTGERAPELVAIDKRGQV